MFEDSTHGGRQRNRAGLWGRIISTHALTEGDHQPAATGSPVSYFNSRPHGGRLHWLFFFAHQAIFQLTPSRRATQTFSVGFFVKKFQLTPSRRATFKNVISGLSRVFQLTPSRRATHSPIPHQIHKYISTHALTEGDSRKSSSIAYGNISTHALTEGDR